MMRNVLSFLFLATALFAQTDSGAIRVFVTDAAGLAVGDAKVEVVNSATAFRMSRITATDGYATFTPITAGQYSAEVSKPGFQMTRITGVSLNVDEHKLIHTTINIASVTSTVEVSAAADIVQSEQGSLGQVIGGNIAAELPLAARRYTELALLVPGATESTLDPTTRGVGWFVATAITRRRTISVSTAWTIIRAQRTRSRSPLRWYSPPLTPSVNSRCRPIPTQRNSGAPPVR